MTEKNINLSSKTAVKNVKDNVFFAIMVIAVIAIVILSENKITTIVWEFTVLVLYYIQSLFSKNELSDSIDKLINNEFKESQKISLKIIQLSEKQKQMTDRYMDMLQEVMQAAKIFKISASKSNDKTQLLNLKIKEAYDFSGKELKSLSENINSMQVLKQKVRVIAELIIELTDYVKQIGSMVSIVENISEQTNMLALNAAVEAARAGEYGKGFSVVASEIRKLADESKQATSKITTLVSEIEQTTSSTLSATEESAKEIEVDVKYAGDINSNFVALINQIKSINTELNDILNSSIEQQNITNDVLEVIETMQKSTSETLKTVEENIENMERFSEITSTITYNIAN